MADNMIVLTEAQTQLVYGGGLKWDSNTCGATLTIGGTFVGAVLGGWAGAGAGAFVGSWIGDNFCPAPDAP